VSHDPGATDGSDNIPSHPLLEGLLGRPRRRAGACKLTGEHDSRSWSESLPWSHKPRADDYTRLWHYLANSGRGAPLVTIVRDVFGDDAGHFENKDYQLAYRFYSNAEFAHVSASCGLNFVSPRPDKLLSTLSMQSAKAAHGAGVTGPEGSRARDVARSRLSRLRQLEDPVRGELLRDLAARREGVDGKHLTLERRVASDDVPGGRDPDEPEHLVVPLASCLSSSSRARSAYQTFAEAWDRAAEEHERGVVATITTDPKRFSSVLEATQELFEDLNRFRSWLAYDPQNGPSRPGRRLPSIATVEFTDSGLPHLHVAFFGASWLTKHSVIKRYLAENLDRCSVAWLDRIYREDSPSGGRWRWERSPDAPTDGRTPREYLGESLELRRDVCDLSSDELVEAAGMLRQHGLEADPDELALGARETKALERGQKVWKAALYFASECRYYTLSPSLREPPADPELPHVTTWKRVMISTYDEIPDALLSTAAVIPRSRPPPWVVDGLRDAGLPSSGGAGARGGRGGVSSD